MGGNQESFSEGCEGGVWSKPQAWLGLSIVRREGGSQLREQASQDPSAECAHSWGVRGTQQHAGEWWEKGRHGICWCYGLNCVLKRYEVLTPSTCECDLFGE